MIYINDRNINLAFSRNNKFERNNSRNIAMLRNDPTDKVVHPRGQTNLSHKSLKKIKAR